MKKIYISLFLFIFSISCYTQEDTAIPVTRLDSLMDQAIALNLFSGNILIAHNKEIAYERSFGKADYEHNISNTSETKFQLASVTKDFTRVMILQLAEQRKLSTTDPISKYLQGFSEEASRVTINQLLDFTSGFGDYHQSRELQEQEGKSLTIPDILPIIKKEKLSFEPGTQVKYSNSGYVILGAIIENVTNKNYYLNLKDLILDKLDMKNTAMNGYLNPLPGIAVGYLSNRIGPLQNNSNWTLPGGGDGGIYTTTHDLLAFILSLFYDNKLLSDSSKLKYASGSMSPEKFKTWKEFQSNGRYSPAGGSPGVSALFTINMKTQNILILLSNYDQGTAEKLGMRVSSILNNKPIAPLHEPSQKYLYRIIKTKGGKYFETNYKAEMKNSDMEPNDDMVLLDVGIALVEDKDYDNAISLYKIYTSLFPGIIIAWNELGEAYLQKEDKTNARICFENVLKLKPENPRAKKGLGKTM